MILTNLDMVNGRNVIVGHQCTKVIYEKMVTDMFFSMCMRFKGENICKAVS